MKALTIWQPWATLIALGLKQYETRSWKTNHRGPLVIHAAKKWGELAQTALAETDPLPAIWEKLGHDDASDLPRGRVVGVCDLEAVTRTERLNGHLNFWEESLGDFSPDRFAWRLSTPRRLHPQLAVRGSQGLWAPPLHVSQEIATQLDGHTRYA